MRPFTVVGALVTALVSPALASDNLEGTRGPVTEREHTVRITLDRGHASLVVRRTVLNGGERHDQAVYHLGMPPGAVAVGLRTRGISQGKPVWFAGDLLEAEAAAAKYKELTGVGGFYPKDPALLSWRDQELLALQVFPVPPGESKTIEYTLVRPMRYENGRFRLDVPLGGVDCARQDVRIVAAHVEDSLWLNDQPFPSGGLVVRPAALAQSTVADGACGEDDLHLALSRHAAPALDGRLAVQGFAQDRVLVHYQVEAAARLSSVPERAHIVVLLDDSRSMSTEQQVAGANAVAQVLQRLPEAQVAVLAFHRKVVPLFPGFRPGVRAEQAMRAYARQRENGSRLDDALRRADELLAKAPPGVRRIYVLSDLRTRNALDPSTVAKLVRRSGALVHMGRIEDGSPELKPDNEGPWAKVARSTGGLLWEGSARSGGAEAVDMARVYEEWVRPTRLHEFALHGPRPANQTPEIPAELAEGSAVEVLGIIDHKPTRVSASGELWAKPVRIQVNADAAQSRLWSALVFGTDLLNDLNEREMMVLARHGRAVSPVTSYLAIEPGVRPSTEGLETAGEGVGGGGTGEGTIGLGNFGTIGRGGSFDHMVFLRNAVASAWHDCGGRGALTVRLETTLEELVDVAELPIADRVRAVCVEEALWRLELPSPFVAEHETWTVAI